jgi:lysophospholipid acyltransferase (LPLAT)-like uncharacterized protein
MARHKHNRISAFLLKLGRAIAARTVPFLYRSYMQFVLLTSKRIFHNFDGMKKLNSEGANILGAAWHQDAVCGPFAFRHYNVVTMVSQSAMGEVMAKVIRAIGYVPIRGGSSRGGTEALAEVIEYIRSKKRLFLALAADGSRGPFRKAKKGIIVIAKECGAAIYPVRTHARWKILLPTWDRSLIPFPFNTLVYFCGPPVHVPPDATLEVIEAKRQELEDRLMELVERSDQYFSNKHSRDYPNESKVVQYGTSRPLDD